MLFFLAACILLINALLGLWVWFCFVFIQARSADKRWMKPTTVCDSSTQTDTHILPPTIVTSYEWNEWELRRKAIKLVCIVITEFFWLDRKVQDTLV